MLESNTEEEGGWRHREDPQDPIWQCRQRDSIVDGGLQGSGLLAGWLASLPSSLLLTSLEFSDTQVFEP